MQTQFLQKYAPNSLHLVYHAIDTGSPGHDMSEHISRFAHRRIDIESTELIGGRVIGHVEHDLGPANEAELQYRILSVSYAETQLNSNIDAVEFVRVIKAAVSAGVDPDPRSFQIWASWAYEQCKSRPVADVLKDLAMMAMELTAVTSTKDERLLDEPEVEEFHGPIHCYTDTDPTSSKEERETERRQLFQQRCDEILNHKDASNSAFTAELQSITRKLSRSHSTANLFDEQAQFNEYLADLIDQGECNPEAIQDSHDRVTEQYDEGGVVSLHMSESEKFVVDGTLDEDVDASYLPTDAAEIVDEIKEMFVNGVPMYSNDPLQETIEGYIAFRLNQIYGDPSDERNRTRRTMRGIGSSKGQLYEYTYVISSYPNREVRQYVSEVLEQIVENMKRDFIFNTMHRSGAFRSFMQRIQNARETQELTATIKDAYQARVNGTITIKMFTALNTIYRATHARFESTGLRVTRTEDGRTRTFLVAAPTINVARTIATRDLRQLAVLLQTLPGQERERVRKIFKAERAGLYQRIQDGLSEIVRQASYKKLLYLRFAFYEDQASGKANAPENMIHLLVKEDKAAIWEQLKEVSGLKQPAAA